jgi:hypothetical protein
VSVEPNGHPLLPVGVAWVQTEDEWMTDNEVLLREIHATVRVLEERTKNADTVTAQNRTDSLEADKDLAARIKAIENRMWAALGASLLALVAALLSAALK